MTRDTFETTVKSLLEGMNSNFSTKSVVGDPVQVGDTTIIPLVDISIGMISGSFNGEKNSNSAGGVGVKAKPICYRDKGWLCPPYGYRHEKRNGKAS